MPFGYAHSTITGYIKALIESLQKEISILYQRKLVQAIDPARQVAILDDGTEMPFDLFLAFQNTRPLK